MTKPILSLNANVVDDDKSYRDLLRRLSDEASHVDVGIHAVSGEELVMIAGVHEFGAVINHPGGQPYIIRDARKHSSRETRRQRGSYIPLKDGKEMVFLSKGKKGMGVTKPHKIHIPSRSYIRSTVDDYRAKYMLQAKREWQAILDGRKTITRALGAMGLLIETDIRLRILSNIPPPLAPETIRRKGSSKSLIDTGALLNSVRYAIKTKRDAVIEMSPKGSFSAER